MMCETNLHDSNYRDNVLGGPRGGADGPPEAADASSAGRAKAERQPCASPPRVTEPGPGRAGPVCLKKAGFAAVLQPLGVMGLESAGPSDAPLLPKA